MKTYAHPDPPDPPRPTVTVPPVPLDNVEMRAHHYSAHILHQYRTRSTVRYRFVLFTTPSHHRTQRAEHANACSSLLRVRRGCVLRADGALPSAMACVILEDGYEVVVPGVGCDGSAVGVMAMQSVDLSSAQELVVMEHVHSSLGSGFDGVVDASGAAFVCAEGTAAAEPNVSYGVQEVRAKASAPHRTHKQTNKRSYDHYTISCCRHSNTPSSDFP